LVGKFIKGIGRGDKSNYGKTLFEKKLESMLGLVCECLHWNDDFFFNAGLIFMLVNDRHDDQGDYGYQYHQYKNISSEYTIAIYRIIVGMSQGTFG
jgi:hypothetical protein